MSISYKEILAEGEKMSGFCAGNEAMARAAIGRCYYGFYHAASQFAEEYYTPPPSARTGGTHIKLMDCFQQTVGDRAVRLSLRQIGYTLKSLHDVRVRADYKLADTLLPADAETTSIRCTIAIQKVEAMSVQML